MKLAEDEGPLMEDYGAPDDDHAPVEAHDHEDGEHPDSHHHRDDDGESYCAVLPCCPFSSWAFLGRMRTLDEQF